MGRRDVQPACAQQGILQTGAAQGVIQTPSRIRQQEVQKTPQLRRDRYAERPNFGRLPQAAPASGSHPLRRTGWPHYLVGIEYQEALGNPMFNAARTEAYESRWLRDVFQPGFGRRVDALRFKTRTGRQAGVAA